MSETLAARFVAARRARGEVLADLVPRDQDEAYAVSAEVAQALGAHVGGWKVGHMPGDETPMAAPMFSEGFIESGATWTLAKTRPMISEIEIAVRLARDLPPRPGRPYTREEIVEATRDVLIGIELIERRIPKGAPILLNLADDLGNIGYVVGDTAATAPRDLDLATLRCRFWWGGTLKVDRDGGHAKGDPLIPLLDWANYQRDRLGGLKAGQVVTLGSLTPMVLMDVPARLEAEIVGIGRVAAQIA